MGVLNEYAERGNLLLHLFYRSSHAAFAEAIRAAAEKAEIGTLDYMEISLETVPAVVTEKSDLHWRKTWQKPAQ